VSAFFSSSHSHALAVVHSRVQNVSATGSTESRRVRLNLTLQVSRVEFEAGTSRAEGASDAANGGASNNTTQNGSSSSAETTAALHISGQVVSENPHVRMGAYHTLDVEPNRDVRIEKVEGWDSVARARVEESCVPGRGAEVGAVVCGEGTAVFCLLSQHMTVVVHRLNVPIPRKAATAGASQHEKAMARFYASLYDAFLRHIPFNNPSLKAIVIASPGWIRDGVYDALTAEATRRGDKVLSRALKDKAIKVHISSPHVHSLVEVLQSPEVGHKFLRSQYKI
jgi:protein pelota